MTSPARGLRLFAGMSLLVTSPIVRRLTATSTIAAIAALALGFCVCEMPLVARETGECHESADVTRPQPRPHGTWSSACCCAGDPRLPPGTLEARAPEAQRGQGLLAAASAFASCIPAFHETSLTPAPPWLVAASPPHAPPPAFVLPIRV